MLLFARSACFQLLLLCIVLVPRVVVSVDSNDEVEECVEIDSGKADAPFVAGMIFASRDEALEAIQAYCAAEKMLTRRVSKRHNEVTVACKDKSCRFHICLTYKLRSGTWVIGSTELEHSCMILARLSVQPRQRSTDVSVRFIAAKYKLKILADPDWKPNAMVKVIRSDLELGNNLISNKALAKVCSRAKQHVLLEGFANEAVECTMIGAYLRSIVDANGGVYKTEPESGALLGAFLCLHRVVSAALINRPVIVLDAGHLKHPAPPGIVMHASIYDINNHVIPIAFAVRYQHEGNVPWDFFMKNFVTACPELTLMSDLVVVSDWSKGINNCVAKYLALAVNARCLRHLVANIAERRPGRRAAIEKYVWELARSNSRATVRF